MKQSALIWNVLILVFVLATISSCSSSEELPPWGDDGEISVRMKTSQGDITIHLLTDIAPRHSENFARLCTDGLYDGTYFHRVAPEVLIQGGDFNTRDDDPANDGMGGYSFKGPGTTLEAEINEKKHLRGTVSMARGSDLNSAGSQFFILLKEDPLLDGQFSVFGEVVTGLEVVELIAEQPGLEYPGIGGVNPEKRQMIEECTVVLPGSEADPEEEISSDSSL